MRAPLLPDDETILSLFERLAIAAANEIIAVREAGFRVVQKSDASPVTEADTRAESVILEGLNRHLPDVPHVGEEETCAGRVPTELGDCFILIDPLDGTREFVSGSEEFTVNIALVRRGKPEIGVVFAPVLNVMYVGRPGVAERCSLRRDGALDKRSPISIGSGSERLRIIASKSHRTAETDAFIAKHPGAEILSVGSSLKFCMLAEGKADLYPRFGRTMEWDTAAGDAVLRAAGGSTQLVGGGALQYGKRGIEGDCDFANPWFISRGQ